jgi:hypothetical protein
MSWSECEDGRSTRDAGDADHDDISASKPAQPEQDGQSAYGHTGQECNDHPKSQRVPEHATWSPIGIRQQQRDPIAKPARVRHDPGDNCQGE